MSDSSPDTGATFTLRVTVRNQGEARSASTTLRYYRSSNATISSSDTAVGTDAVSGLSASGTSAESITLRAPSTAGTYYYGACVNSVADESNTGNNCSSGVRVEVSDGTAGPDLVVGAPRVSDSSPDTGATFTLRVTVRNQGGARSASTTLRYYRSSNARISTSDTQVGTDSVGALAASGSSAESISLAAPSTAGTYYYGACVAAVSGESNSGNNCSSGVRVTVRGNEDSSDSLTEVTGLRLTQEGNSVRLRWNRVPGATHYVIYYCFEPGLSCILKSSYLKIADDVTGTTYLDEDRIRRTVVDIKHYYIVRPCNRSRCLPL